MIKKRDLPAKLCPVCDRPFAWRKAWARDWAQVKYCSERCRRHRGDVVAAPAAQDSPGRCPRDRA